MASRIKLLLQNFHAARIQGEIDGFDIAPVKPDQMEHFYILFQPKTGLFRDQCQILEMKTSYGAGNEYQYPIQAPYIRFATRVFHTNISGNGSICLDILKDPSKWMPTYDFVQILMNIMLLYQDPNTSSPFNGEASSWYSKCRTEYKNAVSRGMSVAECAELEEKCYLPYKEHADKIAAQNDLSQWVKWFPQIRLKKMTDSELADYHALRAEQLAESKQIIEQLSTRRAAQPSDADQAAAKELQKKKRWAKFQAKPAARRPVAAANAPESTAAANASEPTANASEPTAP